MMALADAKIPFYFFLASDVVTGIKERTITCFHHDIPVSRETATEALAP